MHRSVALLATLALSGCLVPTEPAKQADEIASVAAEGALLAHDASESGGTTSAFTRVHAEALRKNLAKLEPKVQLAQLERLLVATDEQLARLADAPDDHERALRVERSLDRLAKRAEGLAG